MVSLKRGLTVLGLVLSAVCLCRNFEGNDVMLYLVLKHNNVNVLSDIRIFIDTGYFSCFFRIDFRSWFVT